MSSGFNTYRSAHASEWRTCSEILLPLMCCVQLLRIYTISNASSPSSVKGSNAHVYVCLLLCVFNTLVNMPYAECWQIQQLYGSRHTHTQALQSSTLLALLTLLMILVHDNTRYVDQTLSAVHCTCAAWLARNALQSAVRQRHLCCKLLASTADMMHSIAGSTA